MNDRQYKHTATYTANTYSDIETVEFRDMQLLHSKQFGADIAFSYSNKCSESICVGLSMRSVNSLSPCHSHTLNKCHRGVCNADCHRGVCNADCQRGVCNADSISTRCM